MLVMSLCKLLIEINSKKINGKIISMKKNLIFVFNLIYIISFNIYQLFRYIKFIILDKLQNVL